ncbi:MAG TPA: glucose 1-dehydrogenase [Leptolyngbyaceae cyanobacterium M33_DOE_097]|uniref:Glucose 1-dehydrogenase n=1 Tax=Oscillatoriales cyanobacterium SpSt-418 TaxID=2282169 RepID=A0A7C3KD36_9CYAN|nr:glucose 1-dehydrogenase [Leptolyngbyaceae cyanobacterium M33_DOE_097]
MNSLTFEDQIVLVTGGSLGIGRATVLAFANQGASVVFASRGVEAGISLQTEIIQSGGRAMYIQADMANPADIETMVEKVIQTYGRIDHAVNNVAANVPLTPTAELTESEADYSLDVNLKGMWLCMKYQLQQMLTQGNGTIVNIASVNGLSGTPIGSLYTASKHGVVGLTRSTALEYVRQGIRINAVCPGLVHTPRLERRWSELSPEQRSQSMQDLANSIPIGRFAQPEEIAAAILWLSSTESSYIVGQAIVIDGGLTA